MKKRLGKNDRADIEALIDDHALNATTTRMLAEAGLPATPEMLLLMAEVMDHQCTLARRLLKKVP